MSYLGSIQVGVEDARSGDVIAVLNEGNGAAKRGNILISTVESMRCIHCNELLIEHRRLLMKVYIGEEDGEPIHGKAEYYVCACDDCDQPIKPTDEEIARVEAWQSAKLFSQLNAELEAEADKCDYTFTYRDEPITHDGFSKKAIIGFLARLRFGN